MTSLRLAYRAATVLLAFGVAAPAFAQSSFKGKTIRVMVNFAAGGPADLLARQFVPFIAKHIDGKPTVIVENRAGAGGVVGANYLFNNAEPDGLTIGFVVGSITPGLIGGENIRYDPAKFRWLGALPTTHVLIARKDLKLTTPSDLLKPAMPLIVASNGASATIANRLFFDMIGARYKVVAGYRGQADTLLALTRGEVNIDTAGLSGYIATRDTIREQGIYDAIVQRGEFNPDGSFRRNRLIPEIPTMIETIEKVRPEAVKSVDFAANRAIVGSFAVHQAFVLPPGTDDAIVRSLRKAIDDTMNDPETQLSFKERFKAEYDFVDGESCERIVTRLRADFQSDPRIAQTINRVIAEK